MFVVHGPQESSPSPASCQRALEGSMGKMRSWFLSADLWALSAVSSSHVVVATDARRLWLESDLLAMPCGLSLGPKG